MNNYKESVYGINSLICLIISILSCIICFFALFGQMIGGLLFYGGLILAILSFVIGLIGLAKDKNKIFAITTIVLFSTIVIFIVLYINFILPHEVEDTINSWGASWGVK